MPLSGVARGTDTNQVLPANELHGQIIHSGRVCLCSLPTASTWQLELSSHLQGSGLTLTSKWHGFNPSAPLGSLRHLPLAKGMQRDQLTWCFVTQLHNTPQNAYLRNSNYSVFSKGTGTHPLKPPEWSWRAERLHWYRRSRSAVRHAPTHKAVWLNLFFKAEFNIKYRNLLRIILLNTHTPKKPPTFETFQGILHENL